MAGRGKLELAGGRVAVPEAEAVAVVARILAAEGLDAGVARAVGEHLADADLSGVESHGVMRVLQYVEQLRSGYLRAGGRAVLREIAPGVEEVDGGGGIGIPALALGVERACEGARARGIAALAVRNVGHTGRLGAFVEDGAEAGCLVIVIGGGNRQTWRQVAPHGGRRALLPTNPYAIGVPGGARGPVVLDFATGRIAGGWIYAARAAGALLPEDAVVDAEGRPTRDPEDYFRGGAILPAGGAKGYALAVVAEMVCEAMLGPVAAESNWLVIALDCARWRAPGAMAAAAEEVLAELRECPPAPGFERVEVPGERERDARAASGGMLAVPEATWARILALAGA